MLNPTWTGGINSKTDDANNLKLCNNFQIFIRYRVVHRNYYWQQKRIYCLQ